MSPKQCFRDRELLDREILGLHGDNAIFEYYNRHYVCCGCHGKRPITHIGLSDNRYSKVFYFYCDICGLADAAYRYGFNHVRPEHRDLLLEHGYKQNVTGSKIIL